jgi:hypothetical protein
LTASNAALLAKIAVKTFGVSAISEAITAPKELMGLSSHKF